MKAGVRLALLSVTAFLSALACTLLAPAQVLSTPSTPPSTETTFALATPYAQQPAAGICAEPSDDDRASHPGGEVVMRLEPGIPDPRCMIILAHQHLRVVNKTGAEVTITLGSYSAVLGQDGETVFETPFGDYLMPGVHALQVDPCCGGELWLKE